METVKLDENYILDLYYNIANYPLEPSNFKFPYSLTIKSHLTI